MLNPIKKFFVGIGCTVMTLVVLLCVSFLTIFILLIQMLVRL